MLVGPYTRQLKQLTLLVGYSSIVVLEICLPAPNTEAAPQTYNPGYVPVAAAPCDLFDNVYKCT